MRILALDVGTKRIGIAISDELLITAQGLESIERTSLDRDLKRINDLIKGYSVIEVVAGLPINMNGSHSAKTREVVEFLDSLMRVIKVPLKTWDERLTSVQAEKAMLEADLTRRRRRALSDRVAAQLILQSYLDSRKARSDA